MALIFYIIKLNHLIDIILSFLYYFYIFYIPKVEKSDNTGTGI
jgi:hypothetical protein